MSKYDYYEAVKNDVIEYLKDNGIKDRDTLYDECFIADSITGNASGSYFCNSYKAAECVYDGGNVDLLIESIENFGDMVEDYKRALTSAEFADCSIRCYVLGMVIDEAIEQYIYENIPVEILQTFDDMQIDDIDDRIEYIIEHTA